MTSMTYGTLPKFEEFEAAFDRECQRTGLYKVRLSRSDAKATENFILGDGEFSAQGLYEACEEIVTYVEKDCPEDEDTERDETAMGLVSGIMGTLGFEWV